eukprot:gnl/TRDRNA2_/TRDRNA2_161486_c0_seq2.p1 gnl/TRDRNA2_/TRDRNA2_161486_c0~~gnl/TRDRNA2_/TRDRNA2_161486_c0_seq2.p1  ORF type:complete len:146 (+),score=26.47 gnl/TRDRNA2_/TRDRNA2_161486_c0_seq2:49-486(+)
MLAAVLRPAAAEGRRCLCGSCPSLVQRPAPAKASVAVAVRPQSRRFTSWWHRWVDGKNPDNPHAVTIASFLRSEGIDPYELPRDEIEELRKNYLTELRFFVSNKDASEEDPERVEEALKLLKQGKAKLRLQSWRDEYALENGAES